jgi:catechol-2,3-dioxygenase
VEEDAMANRFTELSLDCRDPHALAPFWAAVLGYEQTEADDSLVELTGPPGAGPTLVLVKVPEEKVVKNRMHIDLNATDRDRDAEVDRLLALGARRADVGQDPDASWVVLADPEGNEFCVLRSRVEPLPGA